MIFNRMGYNNTIIIASINVITRRRQFMNMIFGVFTPKTINFGLLFYDVVNLCLPIWSLQEPYGQILLYINIYDSLFLCVIYTGTEFILILI
jgi:hypothetical protein